MTTTREVFYGVISQGVTPHFFMMETTKKSKTCTIFGQPDVEMTQGLYRLTAGYLVNALMLGCRVFYFGCNGDLEALCNQILTDIQKDHPELGIQKVFCTVSQENGITITPYFKREDFDAVIALPCHSSETELYDRLCTMINDSDSILCYIEKSKKCKKSNAYQAYLYADKQKDKYFVNLYDVIKSFS